MSQKRDYVARARNLKVHRLTLDLRYVDGNKAITESHKPISRKEADSMVEYYRTRRDVRLINHTISYI